MFVLNPLLFYFQNQPLISYGRPKGDGEVRIVSNVDKRKQDRLFYFIVPKKKLGLQTGKAHMKYLM